MGLWRLLTTGCPHDSAEACREERLKGVVWGELWGPDPRVGCRLKPCMQYLRIPGWEEEIKRRSAAEPVTAGEGS